MTPFIRFLLTGSGGALLNLAVTYLCARFLLGVDRYFLGYLLGIAANLLFNFTFYTLTVFKTQMDHARRLAWFIAYGLVMAFFQASVVRVLVAAFGVQYYLFLIASTIAVLAVLNYFVFRQDIFKERVQMAGSAHSPIGLICLMAVLVRLGVLFHALAAVGVSSLIYGDAIGYRALGQNLWVGKGFVQIMNHVATPEVFRTPGFPLLFAPFTGSDASVSAYLCILAVISGLLLPYFTFRLTERIANRTAACFAALLAAFEPQLVFFGVLPQTEMPFTLFAYGGLLCAIETYSKRKYLLTAFAGVLFGYATFIRPGFWPVYVATLVGFISYLVYMRQTFARHVVLMLAASILTLIPWYVHVHQETGAIGLSGAGWRNVYTDYLASERAIRNHSDFASEKEKLKVDSALLGLTRQELNSPAGAHVLRDYSLHELWQHKVTVVKIETLLLESYFLQDGYYYQFVRFGFLPPSSGPHISPTFVLLSEGLHGMPKIFAELARQGFLPILGRLSTVVITLTAFIGFFITRDRIRYLFATAILLSAITATAIGLGVEARLRLPAEPLLFSFSGVGAMYLASMIRKYADRHRHPSV